MKVFSSTQVNQVMSLQHVHRVCRHWGPDMCTASLGSFIVSPLSDVMFDSHMHIFPLAQAPRIKLRTINIQTNKVLLTIAYSLLIEMAPRKGMALPKPGQWDMPGNAIDNVSGSYLGS